jgi:hypothetical protein
VTGGDQPKSTGSEVTAGPQDTLPGLGAPELSLRQSVLAAALVALRDAGPLTARELAVRLAEMDPSVNRHLINSVLYGEGKELVRHDQASGRYRASDRGGH